MFPRFKRLTWKAALLAAVASLLAFNIALAASGDLDSTFSGDGLVTDVAVPANPARWENVWGIAVQPADGKIVVAGDSRIPNTATNDFAVLRYKPDGTLDTTFSGDGRLITNFGGSDQALDVAVQDDGKIVAVGQKCSNDGLTCDVALARYKPFGNLDPTFSGDGKQTNDFGGADNGSSGGVAIRLNKIVVAGYMWNGTDYDFAVYRYLSDGTPDAAFSGDGMAKIGFGAGRQDFAADLVIQSDGKIIVVGYTGDANDANHNFAIARLNANGSLDATFSGDGIQVTNFGGDDFAYDVALQTDGKIVVAGEKDTVLFQFAVARYNTNGSPDTSFNSSGRKAFSVLPGVHSVAVAVNVQLDGKIVLAGRAGSEGLADFALVRLNGGGSLDTTFSGDGKVTIDFGGDDFGRALALQPADGKYLIGGFRHDGTQRDFALARVLP
jgi:uncharacterized delta-60 repeat protein